MSLLELIYVAVGIIVGLGVTEILTGLVRVLRGELKAGPIHALWAINVFLFLLQNLWSVWGLWDIPSLTYGQYLIILWSPVVLFIAAAGLFPASDPTREPSLDEYLMDHRGLLVTAVLLYIAQAVVERFAVHELPIGVQPPIVWLVAAMAVVSILFTERRAWQLLAPALLLALQIYWAIQVVPVQTAP